MKLMFNLIGGNYGKINKEICMIDFTANVTGLDQLERGFKSFEKIAKEEAKRLEDEVNSGIRPEPTIEEMNRILDKRISDRFNKIR